MLEDNGIKYKGLHKITQVVQATHYQDDVRYGTSRAIQCSCRSLMCLWTLFRSSGMWDKFDLDCILREADQLFKFIVNFRYLGMEKCLVIKLLYKCGILRK